MNSKAYRNSQGQIIGFHIDPSEVLCTYNGRSGCACGCRGKYSYLKETQELGTEDRGYEVTDDEISPRSVKLAINKLNRLTPEDCEGAEFIMGDKSVFAFDVNGRATSVYFKKEVWQNAQ